MFSREGSFHPLSSMAMEEVLECCVKKSPCHPTHVDRSQACGQQRVCVCGPRLQPVTFFHSSGDQVTKLFASCSCAGTHTHARTHTHTHTHTHSAVKLPRPSNKQRRIFDTYQTNFRAHSCPKICFSIPTSWTRKLADILRRLSL